MVGIKSKSSYLWGGMVATQANAPLALHGETVVEAQHVGGRIAMETGTETEFVYQMINAFPAIRGRYVQLCPDQQ